jgi:hypothetical protein
MNFDELIVCTRCGSDACYKQEVTKGISIELCYGCGFQSNSLMKKGTEFFNERIRLKTTSNTKFYRNIFCYFLFITSI